MMCEFVDQALKNNNTALAIHFAMLDANSAVVSLASANAIGGNIFQNADIEQALSKLKKAQRSLETILEASQERAA